MSDEELPEGNLVCGVPQASLERFLILIRDGYPKAELAAFFLEVRAGISSVPHMANVRDTLSHLATFLNPALDDAERAKQVSSAEEHFRRAIIEPYQIAVDDVSEKIANLYEKYKASILPIRDRYPSLSGAPNALQINARLREIEDMLLIARQAKGRNRWDEEWENGVANYVTGFDALKTLHSELEAYWHRFQQINADAGQAQANEEQARTGEHHTQLHIWGIGIAIGTFVLGIVLDALAHHFGWW